MQDDIRPGGAQNSGRKPKVIQPINPTLTATPVIDSFTDDPAETHAPETVVAPVAQAAVEPEASVAEPVETAPVSDAIETIEEDSKAETNAPGDEAPASKSRKRFGRFPIGWPPSKRDWIIIATAAVLLLATGAAIYSMTHRDVAPAANKSVKKAVKPAPKIIYSTLTGLPVADASVNQRPVTGVMIENSPDARPQSSLDQAGVVFEAIAEGGITRFLALFQDTQPDYIGPVRSARPYYVQWCLSFDCAYAHVGGSPDGLAGIKTWGVKDLDQFANSGAYHRISTRYAPHNVYTSMAELNTLETSKGIAAPTFTGFTRKADKPYKAPDPAATGKAAKNQETRTPATVIDFTMSGFYYNVHFDFDAATDTYKRSQAGGPHMVVHQDGSQVQLTPKVVVGLIVPMSAGGLTSQGGAYSNYQTIGSGKALIYQDGTVTTVNWSKTEVNSALTFTDDAGKPFALNAGQTWISAITDASKAVYK
jgi:hypothetical protein